MAQGRPKGCKAEIEVAKILEPWWRDHEPKAPDGHAIRFVRTPLSGGWGGKDTRSGFKASGDLMTTAATFPFTVEVKRREGWKWKPLFEGRRSPVWSWWRQAVGQGTEMRAVPLLWLRHNREPWSVMLPCSVLTRRETFTSPLERMGYAMRLWLPSELSKVDYGEELPALVSADKFLSVEPIYWIRACRGALGQ